MYEKFVELLSKNGVTAYRVAKSTGIAQSTLSDWKNNKSRPKLDKIQKTQKPSTSGRNMAHCSTPNPSAQMKLGKSMVIWLTPISRCRSRRSFPLSSE